MMAKLGCALALASLSSLIKANAETEADLFKDLQYMPVGTQMTKRLKATKKWVVMSIPKN